MSSEIARTQQACPLGEPMMVRSTHTLCEGLLSVEKLGLSRTLFFGSVNYIDDRRLRKLPDATNWSRAMMILVPDYLWRLPRLRQRMIHLPRTCGLARMVSAYSGGAVNKESPHAFHRFISDSYRNRNSLSCGYSIMRHLGRVLRSAKA